MRIPLTVSAILLLAASPLAAHAAVATFQYNGVDTALSVTTTNNQYLPGDPQYTTSTGYYDKGSISFTYTGGPGALSLANLTSFSLTRNVDYISTTVYPTAPQYNSVADGGAGASGFALEENYSQALGDLTSFAAIVDASGNVTSLSFATVPAHQDFYFSLNAFDASTSSGVISYGTTTSVSTSYPTGIFTAGVITQVVPEPASIGALAIGGLALGTRRRRA